MDRIYKYKLLRVIGQGKRGIIYKASPLDAPDKFVAIKIIHPSLVQDPLVYKNFHEEKDQLQRLSHPNILKTLEFVESEGHLLMIWEYFASSPLDMLSGPETGSLSWAKASAIYSQILSAIGSAHHLGVVHGNLKPSNILVSREGLVKVMDFGTARICGGRGAFSMLSVTNTIKYISPEEIQGGVVDARSDIYSLGIILFEMLAGRSPFESETGLADDIIYKHLNEEIQSVLSLNPDVPPEVDKAIKKACNKEAAKRFASIEEFAAELGVEVDTGPRTPGAPGTPSLEPGEKLNEGKKAFEKKDLRRAKEIFEELLREGYRESETKLWLGVTLFRLKDHEKAIRLLSQTVKSDPNNYQAWIYLGLSYLGLGLPWKADDAFAKALAIRPHDPKATKYRERARKILNKLKQKARALEESEETAGSESVPESPEKEESVKVGIKEPEKKAEKPADSRKTTTAERSEEKSAPSSGKADRIDVRTAPEEKETEEVDLEGLLAEMEEKTERKEETYSSTPSQLEMIQHEEELRKAIEKEAEEAKKKKEETAKGKIEKAGEIQKAEKKLEQETRISKQKAAAPKEERAAIKELKRKKPVELILRKEHEEVVAAKKTRREPASILARCGAAGIDMLIQTASTWLLATFGFAISIYANLGEPARTAAAAGALGFVAGWAYNGVAKMRSYSHSLGKKTMGLKVVRMDERYMTLGSCVLRSILSVIGWITIPFSKDRRGLHDHIAKTVVVQALKLSRIKKVMAPLLFAAGIATLLGTIAVPAYYKAAEIRAAKECEGFITLGRNELSKGQIHEAIIALNNAMMNCKEKKPEVFLLLSDAYLRLERPDRALSILLKASTSFPQNESIRLKIAEIYKDMANFTKAALAYEQYLGLVGQKRRITAAEAEKLRALKSKAASMLFKEGNRFLAGGELKKAEGAFRASLKFSPSYAPSLYSMGIISKKEGRYKDAITFFKKSIEAQPSYSPSLKELGMTLLRVHKEDEAMAVLESYLKLKRDDPEVMTKLGRLYLERKQYEKAEKLFLKAVNKRPNSVEAHILLGRLYIEQLKLNNAKLHFQKVLKLDPHNEEARRLLSTLRK